jgi:hypothetical protein
MGSAAQPELSNTCVSLDSFTHIFPLLPLFCFKLESYMQIHMMHVLYHFDTSRTKQWLQKSSVVPWSSLGDSVTPVCLVFLFRNSLSNLSCAFSDDISATRYVFYIPKVEESGAPESWSSQSKRGVTTSKSDCRQWLFATELLAPRFPVFSLMPIKRFQSLSRPRQFGCRDL